VIREFFQQQGRRLVERMRFSTRAAAIQQLRDSYDVLAGEFQSQQKKLRQYQHDLNAILNSRAWRWITRYGRVKNWLRNAPIRSRRAAAFENHVALQAGISDKLYALWIESYDRLSAADRLAIKRRCQELTYKPTFSVIMPVFNSDEQWLKRAIDSVQSQIYTNWELCIADDCSTDPNVAKVLNEYATKDPRIKIAYRSENGHIAAASNTALELATGEFVAFLDHDDEFAPHALYLMAEEINAHPEADLLYSDDDKITGDGRRYAPHFKSEWDPDLLYSMNYLAHLGVYRTSVVRSVGGFRVGFEGSQDYDLALRVIEQIPKDHIRHVPFVLYHWRAIEGSVALNPEGKPYAHEAARRAIRSHFRRVGINASVTPGLGHFHQAIYHLPERFPLVSVVIPTRDSVDLLRGITSDVLERTEYQPLELIVVDNQSKEPQTLSYLRELQNLKRVRVIGFDAPFNFSALNNFGVRHSGGEVIAFLNNDLRVISPEWLKEMVSLALRSDVGAVGAKLYYPNDTIQHAGIIIGMTGCAGHPYKHLPKESLGYFGRLHLVQNFSAVTAACMVMRRAVFEEVGGFDQVNLPIAYNDVDLCLRIRSRGYRILWTPHAELYHVESASRGYEDTPEKQARLELDTQVILSRWSERFLPDPCYSPNLSLDAPGFSLALPPRVARPWTEGTSSQPFINYASRSA
jgi:glycosyltransferase involved in cell wall biosynthesis